MAEKPLYLEGFVDALKAELEDIKQEMQETDDKAYKVILSERISGIESTIKLIELIIQRIKSACKFYLKYKDNPELLAEEHYEYFSYIYKFEVVGDCKNVLVFKDILIDADQYNEWLFKLAFKPVFEDE